MPAKHHWRCSRPEGSLDYATLGVLENTRTLTITNLTLTYAEGCYGKGPSTGPDQIFTPYAELEAAAQLDRTNLHIRLLAPILARDAAALTSAAPPASRSNHRN